MREISSFSEGTEKCLASFGITKFVREGFEAKARDLYTYALQIAELLDSLSRFGVPEDFSIHTVKVVVGHFGEPFARIQNGILILELDKDNGPLRAIVGVADVFTGMEGRGLEAMSDGTLRINF